MSYTKVGWKDFPDKSTPVNATNLSKMDNGIENADLEITELKTKVNSVENSVESINSKLGTAASKGVETTAKSGSTNLITSGGVYTELAKKAPVAGNSSLTTCKNGTILGTGNIRRGTCTLKSSGETSVSFSSKMGGTPTVILTPYTDEGGVIAPKIRSVSASGFTAIIGGSGFSGIKCNYIAIYY